MPTGKVKWKRFALYRTAVQVGGDEVPWHYPAMAALPDSTLLRTTLRAASSVSQTVLPSTMRSSSSSDTAR